MKLGILGDLHFTNRSPERRLDNYFETQIQKFTQSLDIFTSKKCQCIIQAGDFFDTPTVANRVKSTIIALLREYKVKIHCVAGQHDISGHSLYTLTNSPLAVLQSAEVIRIQDSNQYVGTISEDIKVPVVIYGASFGEEIPEPFEDSYNILITHRMIGNRPLYPGQELESPIRFLRKYPNYNLVIAGDYHYRFIETWNGRTIINSGALVRKTISKFDLEHKPAVVIFDTETEESEVVELDVEPVEKVFNLARPEKRDSVVLTQFIEELKTRSNQKQGSWKHVLLRVLKERNSDERVARVIDECLEEVNKDKR